MTALVLTPDPVTASILLEITGLPAGSISITRADANSSGRPVRVLPGQGPIGGVLTVVDYEPALTGLIRYDVRDSASALTTASATLNLSTPFLSIAVLPQLRAQLDLVTGYTSARESTTNVHTIIGRPDPVVTLGLLALRTGTLTMHAADHPAARAIEQLADYGEVLYLRQADHPGLDMYFSVTRTTVVPEQPTVHRRWTVEMSYAEVACPTGPLMGAAGWTFASVTALGSFAAIPPMFATFNDLTIGVNGSTAAPAFVEIPPGSGLYGPALAESPPGSGLYQIGT